MRRIGRCAFTAPCLPVLLVSGLACLSVGVAQARVAHKRAHAASSSTKVHIGTKAARSDNRDPIAIHAAKLDYFDKEQKLVYQGDVVAVRGDTTLKTPKLVVFLTPKAASAAKGPPSSDSQVRRMEASGPVTIISKDQIATGDTGLYIKAENKIYLDGNVALTQGPNVTKGDHLIYDTNTDQAVVTGHVRSMFISDSQDDTSSKTSGSTAGDSQSNAR